jgi:hypothetical protein
MSRRGSRCRASSEEWSTSLARRLRADDHLGVERVRRGTDRGAVDRSSTVLIGDSREPNGLSRQNHNDNTDGILHRQSTLRRARRQHEPVRAGWPAVDGGGEVHWDEPVREGDPGANPSRKRHLAGQYGSRDTAHPRSCRPRTGRHAKSRKCRGHARCGSRRWVGPAAQGTRVQPDSIGNPAGQAV